MSLVRSCRSRANIAAAKVCLSMLHQCRCCILYPNHAGFIIVHAPVFPIEPFYAEAPFIEKRAFPFPRCRWGSMVPSPPTPSNPPRCQ
ncbi:hypothetical protein BR93DRAFT_71532 [Coniochaeta sp. PMI_546]|nr:hypothetical protein BR93DRAFT_71532 [Coniochaeta sp. PMI_546]